MWHSLSVKCIILQLHPLYSVDPPSNHLMSRPSIPCSDSSFKLSIHLPLWISIWCHCKLKPLVKHLPWREHLNKRSTSFQKGKWAKSSFLHIRSSICSNSCGSYFSTMVLWRLKSHYSKQKNTKCNSVWITYIHWITMYTLLFIKVQTNCTIINIEKFFSPSRCSYKWRHNIAIKLDKKMFKPEFNRNN